jgi:DNA repair protein RecO (recombination protein O)
MLHKTRAIVLHSLKYGDTSIIAHLYTEEFGRQSYIIKGAHSKKAVVKANMFSPLNLLELDVYQKQNNALQKIKEAINRPILNSLSVNSLKNAISLFISELLYRTLREEEPNKNLFGFLHSTIQLLDLQNEGITNFHLSFMVQYSKHLGFLPTNNYSNSSESFDLKNGSFVAYLPNHEHIINNENLISFSKLLNIRYDNLNEFKINNNVRIVLLEKLVNYYQLHIPGMGQLKSLAILHEVFN